MLEAVKEWPACRGCGKKSVWVDTTMESVDEGIVQCNTDDCYDGRHIADAAEEKVTTKPGEFIYVEDFKGAVTGGGYKASMDDPKKVPLSLIDPEYLLGTGRVLQHGAKKYAPGNWMRGMSWQEVLSALQRHTLAILNGEDKDPETGELHAYHVSCCAMFLARFMSREEYKQFDDRLFK